MTDNLKQKIIAAMKRHVGASSSISELDDYDFGILADEAISVMPKWRPIEEAHPKDGDIALILAEDKDGMGCVLGSYPQLCIYEQLEDYDGWWNQLLRGGAYGLGLDGEPKWFMPVIMWPEDT